jgi:8-oxo-dGTP pyrophosphatase MutT (NUDIX family)
MGDKDFEAALQSAACAVGKAGVVRLAACRLRKIEGSWDLEARHADRIDAHWRRRQTESPSMFNGGIYLMRQMAFRDEPGGPALEASLVRTDFKSYLYWREQGFPAAGVRDSFGSALIRSAEGNVVLGRQRPGNVNNGAAYLPGGFIDASDVRASGEIDITGSVLRELGEETGLAPSDVAVAPGYIATFDGALVSIARELRSPLPAEALRARILAHIAGDPASELVDAVIVHAGTDLGGLGIAPYAQRLLRWLFSERR